ncbi:glycerophosphodiester phosphodiesterase [Priestia megaterium]|nr:glycerophosphodiester phosphodiesterase [Priestia megaterium]
MKHKWSAIGIIAFLLCIALVFSYEQPACTSQKDVLIIAHRGASGYEPEHTMESYKLAQKMKSDYIEIDLHMSKDQQLVAIHDYSLQRTTNGTGFVKEKTVKQLQSLDAGSWFLLSKKSASIPTLDEIFRTFGNDIHYYIETKSPHEYPGMEKKLIALLNKHNIHTNQIIIQSFSDESLKTFRKLQPSIQLIQLISSKQRRMLSPLQFKQIRQYANGIGPNADMLTKEYVQTARSYGLDIHPYTVNDKRQMRKLIKWGVTGIFTNYPDRLYKVLHHH